MKLKVYKTKPPHALIREAPKHRDWLDALPKGHPYRCLPLSMGSQYGWQLLCPVDAVVRWNGGAAVEDIEVIEGREFVESHFGYGILTMYTGLRLRTPLGWDLYVTGGVNSISEAANALTAIVETDWGGHNWAMNWRLTLPVQDLRIRAGEPFCQFWPVRRGALRKWAIEAHDEMSGAERLQYEAWATSRLAYIRKGDGGWQKDYYRNARSRRP